MLSVAQFLQQARLPATWKADLDEGRYELIIARIKLMLGYSHHEREQLIDFVRALPRQAA